MVSAFPEEAKNREPLGVIGGAQALALIGRFSLTPFRIGALFHLILSVVLIFLTFCFKYLFVYLAVPGLSCSTWDLQHLLRHTGSFSWHANF